MMDRGQWSVTVVTAYENLHRIRDAKHALYREGVNVRVVDVHRCEEEE